MACLKKLLHTLFVPPAWVMLSIAIPGFAALIIVFACGMKNTWLAYVSYAATAYATAVICLRLPAMLRRIRIHLRDCPLARRISASSWSMRYHEDMAYRAEVSLYASLVISLLYAIIKLISGILFHSIWFGALAGYYLLLVGLRFVLLDCVSRCRKRPNPLSEWKRYRLCGGMLLMMNQALTVMVALMVYRSNGFVYPGSLIYLMAMYTFYTVFSAVRNLLLFRRAGSPALAASRAVTLVTALVSVLSLETAMISQFGDSGNASFRQLMTGVTGCVVCLTVLVMAIYMMIHATGRIRALRADSHNA